MATKKKRKRPATKKAQKKKSTAKAGPKSKAVTSKRTKKSKPKSATATRTPKSVDGILKKFNKERTTLDALRVSVRSKIEILEKKANECLEKIDVLSVKEKETQLAISELNSRRDAEVSSLLSELGVKVSAVEQTKQSFSKTDETKSASEKPSTSEKHDGAKQSDRKPTITFATSGPHSGGNDKVK